MDIAAFATLRASHIIIGRCRSYEERLTADNCLLPAAHWEAAFDLGLVSVADDARSLAKPRLDQPVIELLALLPAKTLVTVARRL